MPYGLYLSAAGADVQSQRMEVISNNLANVDTPGFRRDVPIQRSRFAEAVQRGLMSPHAGGLDDIGGTTRLVETATDLGVGAYETTRMPSDLAIRDQPQTFFTVQRGETTFLTRAGDFRFDGAGSLRTSSGETVLGADGTPVTVDPAGGPWRFDPGGVLVQAGRRVPVGLVRVASRADLLKRGENLFEAVGPTTPVEPSTRSVESGVLEKSGVKPVQEMMHLLEASRAHEANIRLVQHQDQAMGSLIGRVLKAS